MTKLGQVLDALVAGFGQRVAPVPVFDSLVLNAPMRNRHVIVGGTGDDNEDDPIAVERTSSTLGPGTWLDEIGAITCAAWAWAGGDKTLAQQRTDADQIAQDCAAWVQSDPSLGGLLDPGGRAEVSGLSFRQASTKEGPLVRVLFTVTYSALLT